MAWDGVTKTLFLGGNSCDYRAMSDSGEINREAGEVTPGDPTDTKGASAAHGFDKVRFRENVSVFDEGDEGDAAYLILSGKVEIRKGVRTSSPQKLAELGKGDAFGEMALFDDSPRMAQAITRSEVELIRISRDEFLRRLQSIDPIMRTTVLYMVKRVRDMANEFMRRKGINWEEWRKEDKPPFIR